jgi:TolA-binding protein
MAQDDDSEARLRRAEAEIRALQRAVFPGGAGRFFEPQITAGNGGSTSTGSITASTNAPPATAVTEILARLDALEVQLQRLTARSEEGTNSLSMLETRVAMLEGGETRSLAPVDEKDVGDGATDTNLAAMTGGASGGVTGGVNGGVTGGVGAGTSGQVDQSDPPFRADITRGPTPERLAAVQQITKPQTGDAADDEYSYGFRLWSAGFLPEARQQLSSYIEGYPNHFRLTYGRNLMGRAFLDDGMPEEAARWFLRNYQGDRTANRAPDSLLYLAEAMIAMEDTRRACIALSEFGETYPAAATGRLADQYESNRRRITCE